MRHSRSFNLGKYGSDTKKTVTIWCNCKEVLEAVLEPKEKFQSTGVTLGKRHWSDKHQRWMFSGDAAKLKASQAYPEKFGVAIVLCQAVCISVVCL